MYKRYFLILECRDEHGPFFIPIEVVSSNTNDAIELATEAIIRMGAQTVGIDEVEEQETVSGEIQPQILRIYGRSYFDESNDHEEPR